MNILGFGLFAAGAVALGLGLALPAGRLCALIAVFLLIAAGILVPRLVRPRRREKPDR